MDNFDDIDNYLDTNMFLPTEELISFFDQAIYSQCDSSSSDGNQLATKNIVSERNRRKKLNDKLYALRAVVPNITKMDKASIIKDAIEYIKSLNEEEMRIKAEISELESVRPPTVQFEQDQVAAFCPEPRTEPRMDNCCFVSRFMAMPTTVEILELSVSSIGEKKTVVSLTCKRRKDTMVKLCQVFESLNLKIITTSVTTLSAARLLKTVLLEADEEENDLLKIKIEAAIAALNKAQPNDHIHF